jgi:carbamoyltransferase
MIILGISGFEDIASSENRHIYSSQAKTVDDLFSFSDKEVPLQFFPLHLIGHDSSAALVVDGALVAFASEERFSRLKHGFNLAGRTVLPRKAIAYCLKQAEVMWEDVDYVAHYCHFTKESVERRLQNVSQNLNSDFYSVLSREYTKAYETRLAKNTVHRQIERISGRDLPEDRLIPIKHHLAHASGAYYSSAFDEAIILTLDGYGEEESSLWAIGQGNRIDPKGFIHLPTSLGLLYQVITAYLGFRVFGDEYKVMGLSSYGNPKHFHPVFEDLVNQSDEGTYCIRNLSRIDLAVWLKERFGKVSQDSEFSQKKADIAASLQKTLEKAVLDQLSSLKNKYHIKNLCVSGGVGLNACANGAILRSGLFDKVFFQPAAGDDGASLGAAMYAHHKIFQKGERTPVEHVFWGPEYNNVQIEDILNDYPQINWKKEENIETIAAKMLDEGRIVGWFQGRMEMGPRALGARSILADPRSTVLRDEINARIKGREPFRPFAPSVLEEAAPDFFALHDGKRSPFMLVTFMTLKKKRHLIPAVVHVDGSSRLQTVGPKDFPKFYRLLRCFYERTGIPVLLNTSFNRAGEPIVNSPEDALRCFLQCGMDVLIIEDYLIIPKGHHSSSHG